ncbi:MAG: DUF4430 domain-containing protein [Ruminococcaceae bacterium]|nr:DUF4430 domain-containing protein [Oscillospiraceae bacterium]
MKTTFAKRMLSAILCIVLVAAVALFTTSCDDNKKDEEATTAASAEVTVLGEGKTQFAFSVVDGEGNATDFEIHTDKKTVGEALVELKLISGEEGPYGLYVKEVNGIRADFDKDGVYWGFYADGEMAPAGADMTDIVPGTHYSFKVTK